MPQVDLHQDCFDVQMNVSEEAPTDVYALADQLLELAEALVAKALKARLTNRLHKQLGPSGKEGNRFEGNQAPRCPSCGSGAAYRKGYRSRTIEVQRLGAIEIDRPYLQCRDCGRSYVPYGAGLPKRKRYARRALRRPIEATVETSYRRGAEAYPESPSASTLWRAVQQAQPSPNSAATSSPTDTSRKKRPEAAQTLVPGTCVADATRIPAREEGTHHSLSIAHAVRPDQEGGPGGRPALHRRPVAARVGSGTRIRDALQEIPIQGLITDGKMNVSGTAERTARCRWHLPRSVRYLLYNDEVTGARNEALTDSIRAVVHADHSNGHAARLALTRWSAVCRLLAPQAATAVERAASGIAVYAEAPEVFTVESTAPAEREMRELNRRFENGGQWTRSGAEHLLQYHQVYRHAPERWSRWFGRSGPA
jgi:YgiT-type zinc finger domain-containing protein